MVLEYVWAAEATELARVAARLLAGSIRRLLQDRHRVAFAVPGGRSAASILRELTEQDVQWERVHIFMADERLVSTESPDSNYPVVARSLIEPLQNQGVLPAENVHPFRVDGTKADGGVGAYSQELARVGGACDVVLLSAGEDGHVASLFPRHSVMNNGPMHILVEGAPKPPPGRMSMSRRLLLRAHACVLVFAGESKREALALFRSMEGDYQQCPATLVKSIPEAYVVTDLTGGSL
jgi:6-phosphogluconolactonase